MLETMSVFEVHRMKQKKNLLICRWERDADAQDSRFEKFASSPRFRISAIIGKTKREQMSLRVSLCFYEFRKIRTPRPSSLACSSAMTCDLTTNIGKIIVLENFEDRLLFESLFLAERLMF